MLKKPLFLFFIFGLYIIQAQKESIQWATNVLDFSTEYQSQAGQAYHASQVLGRPNEIYSDYGTPCAWSPSQKNNQTTEWIKVTFLKPQQVAQVLINQTKNPGAISKVILHDLQGQSHLYFHTTKSLSKARQRIFRIIKPLTPYKVIALTLELQTNWIDGWNNIDAIGISNTAAVDSLKLNHISELPALEIIHLDENINSPYNELLPIISSDGKTLYFDRNNHPKNIFSNFSINDDIWQSEFKNGAWQKARHLDSPINNEYPNYVCAVSLDGNTLFLRHSYATKEKQQGLAFSMKQQDTWSKPQKFANEVFTPLNSAVEFHVSADETIILAALKRLDSYGQRDIYVSFKVDTRWSEPQNLGAIINTADNELTPYLSFDTYTLYFASYGHAGYGSSDIFISHRLDTTWTNWSLPQNLGADINTYEWEASFSMDLRANYAYFAAYRKHLNQGIDIFRVRLVDGLKPKAFTIISGKVLDHKTRKSSIAQIQYTSLATQITNIISTDTSGTYSLVLNREQNYKIKALKNNYFSLSESINLRTSKLKYMTKNLHIIPVDSNDNDEIDLGTVLFKFNSEKVLEESVTVLENVVHLLHQNPDLKVIIEGHTDFGGDPSKNFQLSKSRILLIQNYLIEKGIDKARITLKPMGSRKPFTRKRDEKSRQLNRRVEFRIKH